MPNAAPRLTLRQVIQGFLLTSQARHLSPHTIRDYGNTLTRFLAFAGAERLFAEITPREIEGFLLHQDGLTNKSLLNRYIGLGALWTWAVGEGFAERHVVRAVRPPKPEQREITPYSLEEVRAMLGALNRCRPFQRPGEPVASFALKRPERNRAIILLLLDTGIRSGELRAARVEDLDQRNSRLHVLGKGAKERYVPYSPKTGKALWLYLATRGDPAPDAPLFLSNFGRPFGHYRILHLLQSIGERAGVANVTVHRFRHTCAIQYLRNGGDPYTLQRLLGHNSLTTVRIYLQLAQADIDAVHRRVSPVDCWPL